MKLTVYIETTIPSQYYSSRSGMESKVTTQWTCDWWDNWRDQYQLVSSTAVLEELQQDTHLFQTKKIAMISGVSLRKVTPFELLKMEIDDENKSIDPVVAEVRHARHKISARYDIGGLVNHYIQLQEEMEKPANTGLSQGFIPCRNRGKRQPRTNACQ